MWTVRYLPEAEEERRALPAQEHPSLFNAEQKLAALGPKLRAPHTSAVRRVRGTLRELRPRAGRSPYRALYRQVGQDFVIAAIGPDGKSDRRGFERAAQLAMERLAAVEEGL